MNVAPSSRYLVVSKHQLLTVYSPDVNSIDYIFLPMFAMKPTLWNFTKNACIIRIFQLKWIQFACVCICVKFCYACEHVLCSLVKKLQGLIYDKRP
jgi:hypothetical protein